jgi:hypothetical protein
MLPNEGELTPENLADFRQMLQKLLRRPFAYIQTPSFWDGCMLEGVDIRGMGPLRPNEFELIVRVSNRGFPSLGAKFTVQPKGAPYPMYHTIKYFIQGRIVCIMTVYGPEPRMDYYYFIGR